MALLSQHFRRRNRSTANQGKDESESTSTTSSSSVPSVTEEKANTSALVEEQPPYENPTEGGICVVEENDLDKDDSADQMALERIMDQMELEPEDEVDGDHGKDAEATQTNTQALVDGRSKPFVRNRVHRFARNVATRLHSLLESDDRNRPRPRVLLLEDDEI
jgi:hypothetical protein